MPSEHVEIEVLAIATGHLGVRELQSRLRDLGYYDGLSEAPPWPETVLALQRFQHDHGLATTGRVDAETMTALRESYCY